MALKHYTFWTWYQLLLRVARRAPSTLSLHILLLGVRASVIACNQTEHIFDPPHEGDNSLFSSTTQNTANDALRRVGKCQHTSAVQRLTTPSEDYSLAQTVSKRQTSIPQNRGCSQVCATAQSHLQPRNRRARKDIRSINCSCPICSLYRMQELVYSLVRRLSVARVQLQYTWQGCFVRGTS